MAGFEGIVRPALPGVAPRRFLDGQARSSPPVRLVLGLNGGSETFAFSHSNSLSSYLAAVHKEKPVDAYDMTTGTVKG